MEMKKKSIAVNLWNELACLRGLSSFDPVKHLFKIGAEENKLAGYQADQQNHQWPYNCNHYYIYRYI